MVTKLHASYCISITDLKKDPMSVLSSGESAVVINNSVPVFYCVPPEEYEDMLERLEHGRSVSK